MCNGNTRRRKKQFEAIMTENFPQLMSNTKPQIQEAQRKPSRIKAKKQTPKPYN